MKVLAEMKSDRGDLVFVCLLPLPPAAPPVVVFASAVVVVVVFASALAVALLVVVVVAAALAVAAVSIHVPESAAAAAFVKFSPSRPDAGLLVVTLSWSASQLLRSYMAMEEKSPLFLCIPAPLSLAQRFHDSELTLSQAVWLAMRLILTVSDVEAFL